jgi:hypothetical protein
LIELLNPWAGWFALAAIPIILFFILKTRLREITVPTELFWDEVFAEQRSRIFWQRFRYPLTLLLNLLFLMILVTAALNPVFPFQNQLSKTIVVFDNSASMNAINESGQSRFDEAKTVLLDMITAQEANRQTAIITVAGKANVAVGFTNHLQTLKQAVAAIPKSEAPDALNSGVELAELLTQNSDSSKILVFTDRYLPEYIGKKNIVFFPIGKPLDNVAITRFQPRRSLADAVGFDVLTEISNFSEKPVECRLRLVLEEKILELLPVSLEPGSVETIITHGESEQGGILWATLDVSDSLEADNVAYAVLPQKTIQKLLYYGEDDFFLIKAFESQQNIQLERVTEYPSIIPDNAVLIIHQTVPQVLPKGNIFIIDPQNDCNLFTVGELLESPIAALEKKDTALMRFVNLNGVPMSGARKLSLLKYSEHLPVTLLATPENDPLLIQWNATAHQRDKILTLTTKIKQSDFSLRTSFPILLSHALTFFRGNGGEMEPVFKTGDFVSLPIETKNHLVRLRSPNGIEKMIPVESGFVSLGELFYCGVWEIFDTDSQPVQQIACNLINATESNLRPVLPKEMLLPQNQITGFISCPIRFWLVAAALLLTIADWHLFHRRWMD